MRIGVFAFYKLKGKINMLPNDDGNQEQPAGGAEQPTSPPSGSQQGQQLSPDVSALVQQVESLQKEIRGLQKGTDKRFEKFGGDIKRILELKEQGLDEKGIQRELFLDSLIAGQEQDAPPPPPAGSGSVAGQAPDVESAFKRLEEYNLNQNDSDFLALIRKSSRMDKAAFDAEVNNYVLNKVKPPKPANPADVVQSPVRSGAQEKSAEALAQEYRQKMLDAPRGPKGDAARRALKNEYIQKGVDVHNVDFTS